MRLSSKLPIVCAVTLLVAWLPLNTSAYSGVVSVDSVDAIPGEQVEVPVRLSDNDEPISALYIPLKYSSSELSVDSVSFLSSILPVDFEAFWNANNTTGKVTVFYRAKFVLPIPVLTATDGLLATIFFSVSSTALPQTTIPIDSINLDSVIHQDTIDVHIEERISATDNTGLVVYYPGFTSGAVLVQSPTDVDEDDNRGGIPTDYDLSQNYPNPFNPTTTIDFTLPHVSHVKLIIFNILGQEVATLVDKKLPAGNHQVEFNAASYPSGIYFYRLTHADGSLTRKMTLVK